MIKDYSIIPSAITINNTNNKDMVIEINNIPVIIKAGGSVTELIKTSEQLAVITSRVSDIKGLELSTIQVPEVSTEEDLKSALEDETVSVVAISEDMTLTEPLKVTRDLTINGEGKTLSVQPKGIQANGVKVELKDINIVSEKDNALTITAGGSAKIDSSCTITSPNACVAILDEGSSLEVAGTLNAGNDACIAGNGLKNGTVIDIYDGAKLVSEDITLFIPQNGTVNIHGGEIIGKTAIGIKAGTLNILGGTITANGDRLDPIKSNDGMKPWGDAIAVEVNSSYAGGKEDNNIKIHIAEEATVSAVNGDIIRVLNTANKSIQVTGAYTNATTEGNVTVYTK